MSDHDGLDEVITMPGMRILRISAIDQIPDLLEKLIKNAEKTARKIDEKLGQARELAAALTAADNEIRKQRRGR